MAPNLPNNINDNRGNRNKHDSDDDDDRPKETDVGHRSAPPDNSSEPDQLLPESQDAAREVGLLRQLALCAGLLASDGGLVFMQLMMMPTLQTLGVPVNSITLPGCISGAMALFGVPLLGCFSDRGDNPRARKKPAVVFSAAIFLAGFCLVISGCGLNTWSGGAGVSQLGEEVSYPGLAFNSSSLLQNVTTDGYSVTGDGSSPVLGRLPSQLEATQIPDNTRSAEESGRLPDALHSEGTLPGTSTAQVTHPSEVTLSSVEGPDQQLQGEEDEGSSIIPSWMRDPLGLGIPLVGLLSILGFAFIDMGNDLGNSSQKSFVLASARPAQHVSLLVVGVQMSALGGCVAAALGVTDLASYLTQGTALDTVPGKTLFQCAIFIVLTLLCVLITLLAAPSPLKAGGDTESLPSTSQAPSLKRPNYGTVQEEDTEPQKNLPSHLRDIVAQDALHSSYAEDSLHQFKRSHRCLHDSISSFSFSRLDDSVSDYHLATSCESQWSTDSSRLLTDRPKLRRSLHLSHKSNSAEPETTRRARLLASNSIVYYAIEPVDPDSSDADCESGGLSGGIGEPGKGRCVLSRQSRRLALICCSMFFMCGAWQSFNVCATDYLGKVVYGGDPDAAPDSGAYAAYQRGMSTGSMGVLLLNGVYVVVNFMQKKMLTTVGPKVECFVVCGLQVGCLVTLLLTDHVVAYYVTSTVFGFFRSAMYTIPFMLANEICQEEARLGLGEGEGKANVGSTMALVTSMIPLSNILVSSLTGPLIYSTGDPTTPLYYTVGATVLAAVVFVFT